MRGMRSLWAGVGSATAQHTRPRVPHPCRDSSRYSAYASGQARLEPWTWTPEQTWTSGCTAARDVRESSSATSGRRLAEMRRPIAMLPHTAKATPMAPPAGCHSLSAQHHVLRHSHQQHDTDSLARCAARRSRPWTRYPRPPRVRKIHNVPKSTGGPSLPQGRCPGQSALHVKFSSCPKCYVMTLRQVDPIPQHLAVVPAPTHDPFNPRHDTACLQ